MWMMGYNEGGEMNMGESYNNNMNMNMNGGGSRMLRPLVPRPFPPHHDHFIPINPHHHNHHHHHHHVGEQSKRDFNSPQVVVVSSRWNPTPEQLQTLEELYRRGTRTPSAEEIQQITAQLRRYGKIEGKNVFYWFQNHKARERQKRRRELDNSLNHHQILESKDVEVNNRTCYEVEETRGIATNCSIISEKREKTGMAGVTTEGNDQLLLLHHRRRSLPERNATWQHMMQLLSSSSSSSPPTPTPTPATIPTSSPPTKMSSNGVVSPSQKVQPHQTLQLFPVNCSTHRDVAGDRTLEPAEKSFLSTTDVTLSPRHFIEFLPLKN